MEKMNQIKTLLQDLVDALDDMETEEENINNLSDSRISDKFQSNHKSNLKTMGLFSKIRARLLNSTTLMHNSDGTLTLCHNRIKTRFDSVSSCLEHLRQNNIDVEQQNIFYS